MTAWGDDELRSAVRAYLLMLSKQERGEEFSKAAVRRKLREGPLQKRSDPSIEYRMRNISAVMESHGRKTVSGYIPAGNVGEAVVGRIWELIREQDPLPIEEAIPSSKVTKRSTLPPEGKTLPPMIYFNIGWMKDYAGATPDDPTIGAHGYLADHVHGAEAFNFLPDENGILRGYRPPGDRERTNITNLGAAPRDDHIDGVTVVWMAREPGTGKTLIVGWYRNARVYRNAQDAGMDLNGERHCHSVEARFEDAVLLPPVARAFLIPSSRTAPGQGFGQKPTWYGNEEINKRVEGYIAGFGGLTRRIPKSQKPPKNYDPELRRRVERAAIEHAISHYKAVYGAACPVVSVESEAKGGISKSFARPNPCLLRSKAF